MPASATFARQGSLTAASGPSREGRKAAGVTSARAKMHAFDNCALSTVLQPSGDDSSFTGGCMHAAAIKRQRTAEKNDGDDAGQKCRHISTTYSHAGMAAVTVQRRCKWAL